MITKQEVSFVFQCDCGNCGKYGPIEFRAFGACAADCYREAVKAGWIFYRTKCGTLKTFYTGCFGKRL